MKGFKSWIRETVDVSGRDLSYAGRLLRKDPLFTFVTVFSLAIAIGANTAIFTVLNSALLRPLPYPRSKQLVVVWSALGQERRAPASGPELLSLRDRSRLFDQFAGIWVQSEALTGEGEPESVKLGWVSSNFLSLLSLQPRAGRLFLPEEEGSRTAPVAVLSYDLWRRRYGADPKLIGQSIHVSGHPCTVVGVLPAGFKLIFPDGASVPPDVDIFVPFKWELATQPRDQSYIRTIGRLREGATLRQGQAELDNIAAQLRSGFTEYSSQNLHLHAESLQRDVYRNARPALLALFAGTGIVLLIACANVSLLLLSQANERSNEMTVRAALGAEPARVVRQLLTEQLLLALLGGTAGLGLSFVILRSLWVLQPAELGRTASSGPDLAVLGFNLAVSLFCGLLFGLAPVLRSRSLNPASVLRETSQTITENDFSRQVVIGCEIALTFVMLTSSVLLLRAFIDLLRVDPGFNPSNVLTFRLSLPGVRYSKAESALTFIREMQAKLLTIPTVESVGVVSHLPFDDSLPNWYAYFWREDAPAEDQNTLMADHRSTLPGFFDSLGVTFVAGRNFDTSDEVAKRKVVIIDDALAKRVWPNGNEIGQKLNVENGEFVRDVAEVIGVVKHVQYHSLTNLVRPQLYLPYYMAVRSNMSFTVHTTSSPQQVLPLIRGKVASLDKDLPVANVRLMEDYVSAARMKNRFVATVFGLLAAIALLLSCVGVYGMTFNMVSRRKREIGIRMASGAQRHDIAMLVLRETIMPVLWGGLAGIGLSLGLVPFLSSLLYGVRLRDPAILGSVFVFVLLVGLVASLLPTQRALRGNPIMALRCG
jgi:putative ABC transport system permease protein